MKMIKHLVFTVTLLAASLAHAGSLTIQVINGGNTMTKTVTIPNADVDRIVAAYKTLYPQTCNTADPPVCHASSNAEVFAAFAQGILDGIKANVQSQERAAVGKTATDAVQPVTMQ